MYASGIRHNSLVIGLFNWRGNWGDLQFLRFNLAVFLFSRPTPGILSYSPLYLFCLSLNKLRSALFIASKSRESKEPRLRKRQKVGRNRDLSCWIPQTLSIGSSSPSPLSCIGERPIRGHRLLVSWSVFLSWGLDLLPYLRPATVTYFPTANTRRDRES